MVMRHLIPDKQSGKLQLKLTYVNETDYNFNYR